jgi:hypothetical protein
MPKVAMDYSKTVIYHFVCNDKTIKCSYVGSTTNFNKRKGDHKKCCNHETDKNYHYNVYQTIREHGGWSNWNMIPLEEFPCENGIQQMIREQYWINQLQPDLNCRASYREGETIAEKRKNDYKQNAEKIKEKSKSYREENAETIKERKKKHYKKNAETIIEKQKEYYRQNAEKIKEYYKQNAEKKKEKHKEYNEKNKDKIKEKQSKKYTCDCGSNCSHSNKSSHEKSKKHLAYLKAHFELQNIMINYV